MNRKWAGVIISIALLLSPCLNGQEAEKPAGMPDYAGDGELRFALLHAGGNALSAGSQGSGKVYYKKKPALGILLSAAVPGAGEMYAGSWIKGAVFLGLEVFLWVNVFKYNDDGEELEDEFQAYADEHWDEQLWRDSGDTDGTHTLPDTKTQQYYEMIGKYDQFASGWDDYVEGGPLLTDMRNTYEHMRDDSNEAFLKASYCSMVILANHVLSAFDTAFTISRNNRRVEGKMRMTMQRGTTDWTPGLMLSVHW